MRGDRSTVGEVREKSSVRCRKLGIWRGEKRRGRRYRSTTVAGRAVDGGAGIDHVAHAIPYLSPIGSEQMIVVDPALCISGERCDQHSVLVHVGRGAGAECPRHFVGGGYKRTIRRQVNWCQEPGITPDNLAA